MLTSALLLMFAAAPDAPFAIQRVRLDEPLPSYKGWTVPQLREEYERLDELRPSNTLPIVALLTGITGVGISLVAYAAALGQFRGADTLANISFGLGGTTSAALLCFGAIQLWRQAPDRKTYGAQMDAVQRLADWQERDEQLLDMWERRHGLSVQPPMIGPPPVGPPAPPSAPPVVPGPPIVPGQITMVFPILSARF